MVIPRALVLALALFMPLAARAQFANTEVSAPGSASPFRVTKQGWTWEDLGAVTYSMYRSERPNGGFACILDRHPTSSWTGDVTPFPPGRLFHYLVTAYDGTDDNSPGRTSLGAPRTLDTPCPRLRACCLPDGSCQDLDPGDCATAGGVSGPDGSACATTTCEPLEACCLPDASCQDLTPTACAAVGGRSAGPGTACATTICLESPVACCVAACCTDLTPTDCAVAGGIAQGGGTTCATTACELPEACCLPDGSCEDVERSACLARGGMPQAPGTACAATTCVVPCPAGPPVSGRPPLRLVSIGANFASPIFLTSPADDQRLFILERAGRIRIQHPDGTRSLFLDFNARITGTSSEMGALGLAFHPDYATNGLFYVHYSARAGECRGATSNCATTSEFRVDCADPDVADPLSERILFQVPDFAGNHNGGWIAFGPDGMLYLALGDGGGAGDPNENGQDLGELLGKTLRIDVNGRDPGLQYAVPPDNPFVGTAGARPEIWSWGLRNHWRNAFDRLTGDFYIADVGQGRLEEVNVATAASGAGRGANYGWDDMEGTQCYEPMAGCNTAGKVLPDHEYSHGDGSCSITGGYVYRGCRMPGWQGWYFFADYCTEFIDAFNYAGGVGATLERVFPAGTAGNPVSFGEDANGELYVISQGGQIRRLEPQ